MKKRFALLALLGPALGLAQTLPQQAAAAAAPDAPVPAVPYRPLEAAGISGLAQESQDWKAANATVGQYRGHSGIVRWERAQEAERAKTAPEPAR